VGTTLISEPEVEAAEPMLDEDAPPEWPPVQHIIRNEDRPAKPGTIALCGEKLMGIDLGPLLEARGKVCEKCLKVALNYTAGS
jgi:hypothetical protein